MASKNDVVINVIADTKKAIAGMAKFAVGIGAAVLVARKLVKVGADLVNAYGEQEKAETKLSAAIRATGKEGEMSTDKLGELASSLQKVTTYGDEVTLSAMAMTQQLADLDQEGLEKVTPGILDFAAAMGVDLNTAASLIGKTLGSSTNALTRYGVEVDMSGTKAEKLAAVTQALNDKFGGTAEALAETTLGGMAQFQNAVGDLKEAGGEMIAQFLSPTIDRLTDLIGKANDARAATKAFRDAINTEGGATAEDLMAVDEAKFERFTKNLSVALESFKTLPSSQIASNIANLAEYYNLSLGLVADTAIEMGIITQELLSQNEAYVNLNSFQTRAKEGAVRYALEQKNAADETARLAELSKANAEAAELIAQYSAEFFPQEPLTRIEETAEALAVIQEKINSVALLGGDLSELGALRNALRDLLGELRLADEMGDPADLVFAPMLGLGPPGQIANMNAVTMGMKLQAETIKGVAEIMKDPALLDLPLILQGKGPSEPVDLEYFKKQFTEFSGVIGGKYVPAVKEAIEVDQFWGAIALDSYGTIAAGLSGLTEEEEKLKAITDNLKDSLIAAFGSDTLDMLEGFGAAMVGGADGAEMAAQSLEDFANAILSNLPTLLFQAGLAAFSGGFPQLGAGLIVASGIAAIGKGIAGEISSRDSVGVSSVGGSTVYNYNTYAPQIAGSMLTEREVTNNLLATSAGNNRGY